MTGLSIEQFSELLPSFAEAHDAYFTNYDMNGNYRNNRRRFIIYKNSPLPAVEDRLFFLLVYLKNNPLQEYHAAGFKMDQKHCNSFIHVLYRILEQCLHDAGVMPADSGKKFAGKYMTRKWQIPCIVSYTLHTVSGYRISRIQSGWRAY